MNKSITIGRDNNNDIVFAYPAISRKHALIKLVDREKELFHIEDLGSSNGIYKNGEIVTEADFIAREDKINIAHIILRPSHFIPYFFDDATSVLVVKKEVTVSARSDNRSEVIEGKVGISKSKHSVPNTIVNFFVKILEWETPDLIGFQYLIGTFFLGVAVAWVYFSGFSVSSFYTYAGYTIVLLLFGRLIISLLVSTRRLRYGKKQQRLALQLWQEQVGLATVRRVENDLSEHAWIGYRKFKIYRKEEECKDIYSFYLTPHDKKQLPSFKPGQYLTFRLNLPDHTKPVIRCYSLSDSAIKKDEYRVTIKRIAGGLCSNYFHDRLNEGDILDIKAPSGQFFLDISEETPIVLIGGGIGITPMLSMISTLSDLNSHRETLIFYGVHNSHELVQAEQLEQIVSGHSNLHIHFCLSKPLGTDMSADNRYATRINIDFLKTILDSNNYKFYICGPGAMMNNLTTGLEAWGVPSEHIHYEGFGPSSVKKVAATHTTQEKAKTEISVHFRKSGTTCAWNQESGSLLNLARDHGISIDSGCEAGNCGTCVVAIREGEIEYMNEPGDMPEKGSCLTCIAIPKSQLSLDA
ncbi:MAG: FHA domain-containing protein [Methylococcaceae bacterium]